MLNVCSLLLMVLVVRILGQRLPLVHFVTPLQISPCGLAILLAMLATGPLLLHIFVGGHCCSFFSTFLRISSANPCQVGIDQSAV